MTTDTLLLTSVAAHENAIALENNHGMLFIHATVNGQASFNYNFESDDDDPLMFAHAVRVGPYVLVALESDGCREVVKIRPGDALHHLGTDKVASNKLGFTVLVEEADGDAAEHHDFAVDDDFAELMNQAVAFGAGPSTPSDREYDALIARDWDFDAIVRKAEVVLASCCVTDMST